MQETNKLKILFVSAEVAPFAKTGGLADVAGSLPQALAAMGNDVRVAMPRYKSIDCKMSYVTDFPVQVDYKKETCIVRETEVVFEDNNGKKLVPVYFIDNYHYYDRDGIYCHYDDGERFAFLCNAVMEMLPRINFQPDIIHCNDWHAGPVCMILNEKYKNHSFYKNIKTVYTIHNLEYQGNFPKDVYKLFNMKEDVFVPEKVEFYGMFSFMKAGLVYADKINTVSAMYASEIQTSEYGEKLEGLLQSRADDLCGIVNGISYDYFNPSKDPRIAKNYSEENIEDKKENKYALQKELGLPVKDVPVMGLISRLAGQKGLNLVLDVIDDILALDVQFVLLGEGDPYYENAFKDIMKKYPDKVGVRIEFNASLAQRIYAASDIFLMPSKFEPCGLGQIISFRYGTIPVVRAVGGLAETVLDYDADKEIGNGFSFAEFTSEKFFSTLKRCLNLYSERPLEWQQLVKRALTSDFSWKKPSVKYMEIYRQALEKV
ncbi:MAG: glycogen synthase GlgA [Clostridia bacterium]|nr:glycogen synthase GlgA [Clostridia bacterium]